MIETGGIRLDFSGTSGFLSRDELLAYAPRVKVAAAELVEGTSPGSEFLGWLEFAGAEITDLGDSEVFAGIHHQDAVAHFD